MPRSTCAMVTLRPGKTQAALKLRIGFALESLARHKGGQEND